MSRGFFDNNKDIDSEAEVARRKTFIAHAEAKYEQKLRANQYDEDRLFV